MIRIFDAEKVPESEIFSRREPVRDVSGAVSEIIEKVRREGDAALKYYSEKFDGVSLERFEVTRDEIENARESVGSDFLRILERAAANIRRFHEKQLRTGFEIRDEAGIVLGQKITPVDRAGLYVPGGTAAYPSTVLMDAIPAKIAGVGETVMVTPPSKNGGVNRFILAAASVAGVDRIFKVGGAQAIAALAYGTESVPRVDKIVGPGNAFVAEAKRQVYGQVSIDMIAGPSEILVIADKNSDPVCVAADLLSQAEHDRNASAVLVTDSRKLALAVRDEIERQIEKLERKEIARESIDDNGKIIVAKDIPSAVAISDRIAPEHLELCLDDPFSWLGRVKHAGSVFLGRNCPEALGDYIAGPNHTLPTGGSARFASPLSVDDFVKKTQFIFYPEDAASAAADDVAAFARCEGLTGHAQSALTRKKR